MAARKKVQRDLVRILIMCNELGLFSCKQIRQRRFFIIMAKYSFCPPALFSHKERERMLSTFYFGQLGRGSGSQEDKMPQFLPNFLLLLDNISRSLAPPFPVFACQSVQ